MTLIITAVAGLVAAVIYLRNPEVARANRLGALVLIYVGAALMWCVDGFACLAEGEPFIELTDAAAMVDDALLGGCVVLLGLVAWLALRFAAAKKAASVTA